MRYFGGKQRIAKPLNEFLNSQLIEGQTFIDLFCGSCNVVSNIRQDVKRYANDKNKYLPVLFERLQHGMKLPTNISVEDYYRIKDMPETSLEDVALKHLLDLDVLLLVSGGEDTQEAEKDVTMQRMPTIAQ